MASYNILDARNNLSRLVAGAESGLEVTITRRGKPVAKLVPADDGAGARSWDEWFDDGPRVSADFLASREQGAAEERSPL